MTHEMRSIIGHRIDYNGVGALKGQRHTYPAKINPNTPLLRGSCRGTCLLFLIMIKQLSPKRSVFLIWRLKVSYESILLPPKHSEQLPNINVCNRSVVSTTLLFRIARNHGRDARVTTAAFSCFVGKHGGLIYKEMFGAKIILEKVFAYL